MLHHTLTSFSRVDVEERGVRPYPHGESCYSATVSVVRVQGPNIDVCLHSVEGP